MNLFLKCLSEAICLADFRSEESARAALVLAMQIDNRPISKKSVRRRYQVLSHYMDEYFKNNSNMDYCKERSIHLLARCASMRTPFIYPELMRKLIETLFVTWDEESEAEMLTNKFIYETSQLIISSSEVTIYCDRPDLRISAVIH